jgi:hypothetical protein
VKSKELTPKETTSSDHHVSGDAIDDTNKDETAGNKERLASGGGEKATPEESTTHVEPVKSVFFRKPQLVRALISRYYFYLFFSFVDFVLFLVLPCFVSDFLATVGRSASCINKEGFYRYDEILLNYFL